MHLILSLIMMKINRKGKILPRDPFWDCLLRTIGILVVAMCLDAITVGLTPKTSTHDLMKSLSGGCYVVGAGGLVLIIVISTIKKTIPKREEKGEE